jgi:exodeoxyribonuclease VII large subunit
VSVPSSAAAAPVITPNRLARYLEKKLADDRHLHYVGVQGEVSNLRVQANGNVYFSLKDKDAVLNCVAFAERAAMFPAFDNGADVIAYGEVKIYAKAASSYQLVASKLELTGVGALHAKYEELSAKLQREGLFAAERKKPAPRFPFRVALVGSPTGDGTRDFITQARQRAPHVGLRLFSTPVNGVGAVPEIVQAIRAADTSGADLVVVVRGGGSYEDLFGFSDERVVRAIAACATATVAAIGHERDQPLIELAADVRASTPSTAAQTVLPKREDLLRLVSDRSAAARRAFGNRLLRARSALDRIEHRSPVADPGRLLQARRQAVDTLRNALPVGAERQIARSRAALLPLERRLTASSPRALFERRSGGVAQLRATLERIGGDLTVKRFAGLAPLIARLRPAYLRVLARDNARLDTLKARFDANNHEALLKRGYAIVRAGGRVVRDAADAPPGTVIEAELARGTLRARVEREGTDDGEQIKLF